MRARPLKPPQVVRGNRRGGQIWTINGDTVTIRAHAEANIVRDYDVPASMAEGFIAGDAVCLTVAGDFPFAVVAVEGTRHVPPAPVDQPASVAAGIFSPGEVPRDPGESPYWHD